MEVLLAVVITALLTTAIFRVTTAAFGTLSRAADLAVAQSQTVTLYQSLQQDFSAASDIYLFNATYPADPTQLCTTGTSAQWTATDTTFVRELLAMPISLVSFDPSQQVANAWIPPVKAFRGYEVRNVNGAMQLWQETCLLDANGAPLAPNRSIKLVDLGNSYDYTKGGVAYFTCKDDTATVLSCPAEASTTTVATYTLALPISMLLGKFSKTAIPVSTLTDIQTLMNIPLTRMVSN